ncbi:MULTISPECIES: GNAT family N-acetyltransferase [unclassified Enterococcus]|uniref:GNAT family N-acetyltransferase n=1 Tax=unclassified Enterococcus TaxID=2608891 RepID=UPI0013ECD299|nr:MULTISPECIES: GNAT family N-acetyltransferase [unclassified Enterococcus]
MVEFSFARREDLPRIVEIYNQSIPTRLSTADLEPVTVESKEAWFEAHRPETRPLWLMQIDQRIVGWISLSDFYGRPAYEDTAEISIYVDADFRKHGLGQKAITFAESQLPALGITTLLAFVFRVNQPSQALFKRNGFDVWGHLPRVAKMDHALVDLDILGKEYRN